MFTRTWDAEAPPKTKLLSNNGDVVEIRAVLSDGLRVRNEDGAEGKVNWSQMRPWRAPSTDPIMATVGYAITAHTAQSLTRSDTIFAAPHGTSGVGGEDVYVAMSRHVGAAHLVLSESAERKAIVRKQMIGAGQAPTRPDVMHHIADNFSRFATPERATDVMRRANKIERGRVDQPNQPTQAPSIYQRMSMSPVMARTMEMARDAAQSLQEYWSKAREAARQTMQREPQHQAQEREAARRQQHEQAQRYRGPTMGY